MLVHVVRALIPLNFWSLQKKVPAYISTYTVFNITNVKILTQTIDHFVDWYCTSPFSLVSDNVIFLFILIILKNNKPFLLFYISCHCMLIYRRLPPKIGNNIWSQYLVEFNIKEYESSTQVIQSYFIGDFEFALRMPPDLMGMTQSDWLSFAVSTLRVQSTRSPRTACGGETAESSENYRDLHVARVRMLLTSR